MPCPSRRLAIQVGRGLALVLISTTVFACGCGMANEKPVIESEETEKENLAQAEVKRLDPGTYKLGWRTDDGQVVLYTILIPEGYVESGDGYPLVLSLHQGPDVVEKFMGATMLHTMVRPAVENMSAIVVAPDMMNRSWVNYRTEECVMALLERVCSTYNVDRQRVLVVGYSDGASGVWNFVGKFPNFFTAAIPVAGHPPTNYLETRWTVPMLLVNSVDDEIFPFEYANNAVAQLAARGDPVQIFPQEGISHYQTGMFFEPFKEATAWVEKVWEANKAGSDN